jgi:hypothetical protein
MNKNVCQVKVGDILIAKKNLRMKNSPHEIALIKNKKYIVTSADNPKGDFTITSEYFSHHSFNLNYFYTLNELRKNKLKKLENI